MLYVLRRIRRRHDDVRASRGLTTNDDEAYKAGAWRLAGLQRQPHSALDPQQSEFAPYHHHHRHQHDRDSNEYASIWEPPWTPAALQDSSQDSARRAGIDRPVCTRSILDHTTPDRAVSYLNQAQIAQTRPT